MDAKPDHQSALPRRKISRPPMLTLSKSSSITYTAPPRPSSKIEELCNSGMIWAAASRRGRRRVIREDFFASLPFVEDNSANDPVSVFGVFDGHGGQHIAQFVSHRLPQLFLNRYRESEAPLEALRRAFLETDKDIMRNYRLAHASLESPENFSERVSTDHKLASVCNVRGVSATDTRPQACQKSVGTLKATCPGLEDGELKSNTLRKAPEGIKSSDTDIQSARSRLGKDRSKNSGKLTTGCGTTATMAIMIGTDFYVAHVGDTRAVLSRKGGVAIRLLEDHRLERGDEAERIEAAGGWVVNCSGTSRINGVLALSRAIGDPELKEYVIAEPEISKIAFSGSEEFIVIASDGIWDHMSDQECIDVVRDEIMLSDMEECITEETAAKILVQKAVDRGSCDDVTALIVNLHKYFELLQQERDGLNDPRVEEIVEEVNYEKFVSKEDGKEIEIESMTPAAYSLQTSRAKKVSQW